MEACFRMASGVTPRVASKVASKKSSKMSPKAVSKVASKTASKASSLGAGLGLRHPHHRHILAQTDAIDWLEVHTENYMEEGESQDALMEAARHYPISLHGVALSLGGDAPLDKRHLKATARLAQKLKPALVSEHLTWVSYEGIYLNDLIPLPRTTQALDHICQRIRQVQDYLGTNILVENPVRYIEYSQSEIPEPEFLNTLAEKSGCGLLLDINNVYVNSQNNRFSGKEYISKIDASYVGELHLAGFLEQIEGGETLLIDSHDCSVDPKVWRLYRFALGHLGKKPTLVERDGNIPPIEELVAEVKLVRQELAQVK